MRKACVVILAAALVLVLAVPAAAHAPTLTIDSVSPSPATVGDTVSIGFTVSHGTKNVIPLGYQVDVSGDGGTTWTSVQAAIQPWTGNAYNGVTSVSDSVGWNTTGFAAGTYIIRVQAAHWLDGGGLNPDNLATATASITLLAPAGNMLVVHPDTLNVGSSGNPVIAYIWLGSAAATANIDGSTIEMEVKQSDGSWSSTVALKTPPQPQLVSDPDDPYYEWFMAQFQRADFISKLGSGYDNGDTVWVRVSFTAAGSGMSLEDDITVIGY